MRAISAGPTSYGDAVARFPVLRQSLLSKYDDCPLSTFFELEYARGWSTHPQARGTLFHRFAAEALRTMRLHGHERLPVTVAREILIEVCEQRDVPAAEIVRMPLRMMPELRMAVDKFARDNVFSISKIVDVERRLQADLKCVDPVTGEVVLRTLSGQLDALLWEPPARAVVIDWKDTWGLPPEPRDRGGVYDDDELRALSYQGYFQQRVYGFLVLRNYSNVMEVTLREFYARRTVARKATIHRHQLSRVEEELRVLVMDFDRAVQQGSPLALLRGDDDGWVDIEALGFWKPSPGKHCGFCPRAVLCPIEEDVRASTGSDNEGPTSPGSAATSPQSAALWAARLQVAERIRAEARSMCKGWVETGGAPIPVKWGKGRRMLGWYRTRGGRKFGFYTPEESDRAGVSDYDEQLCEAMRASTQRARLERGGVS